jgi:beta-phosphoglucomutase-like phosphatase (HAD superfamily)
VKVVLFDIDGTLVLTGGAGARAMTRAFADVFGVRDGLSGVSLAGRTETSTARWCLLAGPERGR